MISGFLKFKFMKNIFYIILFFTSSYSVTAQTYTIDNQVTFGGNQSDVCRLCKKTSDGDFILGGFSNSGISGDKTDSCKGVDYWLVKFNSSFIPQWQKSIRGNNIDELFDLLILPDSSIILIGLSASSIGYDKTVTNYGSNDFWIVKLDKNQNIIWQKTYGGTTGVQEPVKAILRNNGDVLIAGVSTSDSSGTKTENSRGGNDYWLIKIDTAGSQLWDRTYGGSDADDLCNMDVFTNGDILLSGYSRSPISGEKTEGHFGSVNDWDNWIIKLDSNGNKLWDKTIGGDSTEQEGSVAILNNKIYLASVSASSISGLKTENSKGGLDYWIIKLDSAGNVIWDKTIGGDQGDIPKDISIINGNRILISGSSSSGISGDKNEVCRANSDYWIYCIDTNANYIWQKTIGGTGEDGLFTTLGMSPNHYILAGYSNSGISGEKTDVCRGNYDYWAVELSVLLNNNEQNLSSEIHFAPNPVNDYFYISTGNEEIFNISIFNLLGEKVFEKENYKTNENISARKLKSGVYFCKITFNSKITKTLKFIKN